MFYVDGKFSRNRMEIKEVEAFKNLIYSRGVQHFDQMTPPGNGRGSQKI
jgi:hypothetical protein